MILLACILTIIGLSLFVNEKAYAASDKTPLGAHKINLNKEVTGETYPGRYDYKYYKFTTLDTNGVDYKIIIYNTGDFNEIAYMEDDDLKTVFPTSGASYLGGDSFGPKVGEWCKPVFDLSKNRTYYIKIRCGEYNNKSTFNFTVKAIIKKPTKGMIKKVKPGKKNLTVSFYKSNYATEYQVAIKRQGGKWKTYNNGTKRSRKFTGLKRRKKYSVKVRGIRVYDGKEYKGKWSAAITVKVK